VHRRIIVSAKEQEADKRCADAIRPAFPVRALLPYDRELSTPTRNKQRFLRRPQRSEIRKRATGSPRTGRLTLGMFPTSRNLGHGLGDYHRTWLWKTELSASTSGAGRLSLVAVTESEDEFELESAPAASAAERLTLDLDGWEGPLDLLLTLARSQKVDLAKISILALVEQYLAFIADAKKLRLEIAADYLVMAAWLAYLKSCLLLPKDPMVDPSPEELAMRLQLRLQRLQAMREAGARLMGRDRIGRDVFLRPAPEGLKVVRKSAWQADLYDLIAAYGIVRARTQPSVHVIARRPVMTLDEALHRLGALIGAKLEWTRLESFLPATQDPEYRRSALASSFVATLELARLGKVSLQQDNVFGPLYVRAA